MISKPTLLLDVNRCKKNIKMMALKANANHIEFRPHFKTHQSHEIGEWFRDEGVSKITVSSIEMALYFAKNGWKDITIAMPTNILEITQINKLASSITLNILVESVEIVALLEKQLTANVNVFIKVNIGNNRAGILPSNTILISSIIKKLIDTKKLNFIGFLGHAGHSYSCRTPNQIEQVHEDSIQKMKVLKEQFIGQHPNLLLSIGDTPTCKVINDFSMVDEFRPGVFVFGDSMQLQIGSCVLDEIAIAMACPVVAIHKDKNEILIYGGSVHFASDKLLLDNGATIFGRAVTGDGAGWGDLIEGVYLKKISQEHGMLAAPTAFLETVKIGDLIKIIPVHACTTANLYDTYLTLDDKKIKKFRL